MRPPPPDHAADPVGSAPLVNLPNALTTLRVVLVPAFGWLLLNPQPTASTRAAAAVLFVVAALTDLADGALARRMGLVTTFGKVADPIADKALMGVALVGLSLLGDVAWWVTVVILAREVGVTLLRFWVIADGVIPASRGGKAKTMAQALAVLLYLVQLPQPWAAAAPAVMGVAVVLTVATGADYVARAVALHRDAHGRPLPAAPARGRLAR